MRVIAGSTAVVTGAARGIGRAIAEALVREGVKVALVDRDGPLCEQACRELAGIGPAVRAYPLDVRDGPAFAAVVDQVGAELGAVDILVNNAGIMSLGGFLDQDPALDDRQIDVNLRGVIHGMRAAVPGMVRRGRGHVVNVASVAGKVGVPNAAVYAATKHAVVGLTEAAHHELHDRGVWCSYVLPSLVDTELLSGAGRLRYPPVVKPAQVAAAVVHALRTGEVDVYVPRFGRLAAVLPAVLPRRVVETVGRWFGIDRVFDGVDPAARAAYQGRLGS
ncbi:MAG: SDR family NAD(P)-dependent oxidoreductase [Myxococcota bacterium]